MTSDLAEKVRKLGVEITEIHQASGGTYGALRVTHQLRRQGVVANRKQVARVMRERG